jgi:hypothetical protein
MYFDKIILIFFCAGWQTRTVRECQDGRRGKSSGTTYCIWYVAILIWAASWQKQHNGFATSMEQDQCFSLSVSLLVIDSVSKQHGSWSDCANGYSVGFVVTRLICVSQFTLKKLYGSPKCYKQKDRYVGHFKPENMHNII